MSQYSKHIDVLERFLTQHRDNATQDLKYQDCLQAIANRQKRVIEVELDDMLASNVIEAGELVPHIQNNTKRYIELISTAIDKALPMPEEGMLQEEDPIDVLATHRHAAQQRQQNQAPNAPSEDQHLHRTVPPELRRRYEVRFVAGGKAGSMALRLLRADHIGHLVTVEGIVTRVTEVKPMLRVATYVCDQCGAEVYQEVTGKQYMPIVVCPSLQCVNNQVNGRLYPQTRGSKFVKYQELRLQEMANQVPVGHVPRSVTVHISGELTRMCNAGDIVSITGVFLPEVLTGFRGLRSGLSANTYLEAMGIRRHVQSFEDDLIDDDVIEQFRQIQEEGNTYNRLAKSIAPEIFGMEDVKKALLLQLVGAATRTLQDKMTIRGDINVLLVGDPGVAKSQLLKHIALISPRGVYTTGKGSSGVGLTAAVLRDQLTNEITLEGGALVLADMGICCIDEFDKMGEDDRTSIHEVMEQQTVSIAKAGITTTLNARASVLAAANPFYGRYNAKKKVSENVNLPTSLISRFDLLYLLIDRADEVKDHELARHVTYVHRHSEAPPLETSPVSSVMLRKYIAQARRLNPHVPSELTEHIVERYVSMRSNEMGSSPDDRSVTPRSLLSILRIAHALARLRFSDAVEQADVDEAMRLMDVSKSSISSSSHQEGGLEERPVFAIYEMILEMSRRNGDGRVTTADVRQRAFMRGFTEDHLQECLDDYTEINVFQMVDGGDTILVVADN